MIANIIKKRRFLKTSVLWLCFFSCFTALLAQNESRIPNYWQQKADYVIAIEIDTSNHQFKGKQTITYTNNSPDTLREVFFHLYYNAFQSGSAMDIRSRTIPDPDKRIAARIAALQSSEIGFHFIDQFKQNNKDLKYTIVGTVMRVTLAEPILPQKKSQFTIEYTSQIPLQIRRTGRMSTEGIHYSMTQWYPKIAKYDDHGWHADPYIGREFYSDFGDYEVKITLPANYILSGSGKMQLQSTNQGKKTWVTKVEKVHDFVFAADPNYIQEEIKVDDITFYFVYVKTEKNSESWAFLKEKIPQILKLAEQKFGKYPYSHYSFIQGGDGGMEYPLCTLITGDRSKESLLSVAIHEFMHSWFQGVIATNELEYPWMDEGFTTYASNIIESELLDPQKNKKSSPFEKTYAQIRKLHEQKLEESLSIHADFFKTNVAYSVSSYAKGSAFLHQLSYIIGKENFEKGMLAYYETWKFKHPKPADFRKVMEKVSGIQLDWYFQQAIHSTDKTDYAVEAVEDSGYDDVGSSKIILKRKAPFVMPLDVAVKKIDGTMEIYTLPLDVMHGAKTQDGWYKTPLIIKYGDKQDDSLWDWVDPLFNLYVSYPPDQIAEVKIDPSGRLLDFEPADNQMVFADLSIISAEKKGSKTKVRLLQKMGSALGFSLFVENKKNGISEHIILSEAKNSILEIEIPIPYKEINRMEIKAKQGFVNRTKGNESYKP